MSPTRSVIFYAVTALFSAALGLLAYELHSIPAYVAAGVIAAPALAIIACKHPVVPVVGLLFVGSFKTEAASGISPKDPTIILVVIAAALLFFKVLLQFARSGPGWFHDIFAGQGTAVSAFLLLTLVVAFSYAYSPATSFGAMKLARFLVFNILLFFAPLLLFRSEEDFRVGLKTIFLLTIALAGQALFRVSEPPRLTSAGDIADITLIGSGQLIGITLLILLYYPLAERRWKKYLMLFMPLFAAGMIASGARGPVVSFIGVLVATLVIMPRRPAGFSKRAIVVGLLALVVVFAMAVMIIQQRPAAKAKFQQKEAELMELFNDPNQVNGTTATRFAFYRSAIREFASEPLLGGGMGSWPVFYYGQDRADYPHNLILEFAAEQGLAGLSAFLIFIAAVLAAAMRLRRWSQGRFFFLVPVLLFVLMVGMFSSDMNNRILWFWSGTVLAVSRMGAVRRPEAEPVFPLHSRAAA